jgi:hypothetical protein
MAGLGCRFGVWVELFTREWYAILNRPGWKSERMARSLLLFFVVCACMSLCLQSAHQSWVGLDLPLNVLVCAGETRLVSPLPLDDTSSAQRTASFFFSQANPLALDHREVLMSYLSGRRALGRFRVVLLPGFPLEILKPPILSF